MSTFEIKLVATLSLLIDSVAQGSVKSEVQTAYSAVDRNIASVATGATEASFKPGNVTQIDFLYIKPSGSNVLVRTVAAGAQYDIPDGGAFLIEGNSADVSDILISGGSADADVEIVVGQI